MLHPSASASRRLLSGLLLLVLATLAAAQNPLRDDLKGRWMNFEVGSVDAFAFDPGSGEVYTFNQPGARVFHFPANAPSVADEVPVGPGTASIAFRPGTQELWIVDRVTATVAVLDTLTGSVERTLAVGAEPHVIVFTPDGSRAYVSCSAAGQVDVIDTVNFAVVQSIAIPSRAPRGLAIVGDHLYVAPLLSGNGSSPRGNPTTGDADDVVDIEVPGPASGTRALPDRDLFGIAISAQPQADALDQALTTRGLGTVLFNLRRRPGTGELWLPNTEALNVGFQGEKSFIDGQVSANRITVVDSGQLGLGNNAGAVTIIDLDTLIPVDQRASTPTDVAFTSDGGTAFVSGYGSNTVAVLSLAGGQVAWLGSIHVRPIAGYPDGAGPRSLLVSPDDQLLFLHNKGENGMARIPLAALPTTPGFSYTTLPGQSRQLGWDPLPVDINQGRIHFNRTQNSLSNTSSCMTCHVDGHLDGVTWDLGGFLDPEGLPAGSLSLPIDNKGPLVTQSVRHIKETGPYHWRGEKKKLIQFNGTFTALMEREEGGVPTNLGVNFRYITQYMETLAIAPNPRQARDRGLTPEQAAGLDLFRLRRVMDDRTCSSCHTLPLGTRGEITDNLTGGLAPATVVPSLREVADKTSPAYLVGGLYGLRTESGIGYGHTGVHSRLESFLIGHVPAAGSNAALSPQEARQLAEFLRAFDTGMAPAAAWQATANAGNYATFASSQLAAVQARAQAGDCDLVYRHGPQQLHGKTLYLTGLYDPGSDQFVQAGANLPRLSTADLMALAAAGQPVTFLGVPPFMGLPMGLDRDNDKLYDLDELALGTDPENNDTDGDGFHDGYERAWQMDPLVYDNTSPDQTPPTLVGSVKIVYLTSHAVKLEFHTDEPVRALLSYNGGLPVLRAPLKPKQDVDFSVILSELEADTVYDIQLGLTDLAGNVALPHVALRTLPYVLPTPAHISELDLQLVENRTTPGSAELLARVTMELEPGAPAVGYATQVTAYYAADDESLQVDLGPFGSTTSASGRCTFRIPVPANVPRGQGRLYFTVEHVQTPAGMPIYARGDDVEMFSSTPY